MSYQPLKGQKALVTGASSGIGAGVAMALGQAGADVVVNYAGNSAGTIPVIAAIEAAGGRAIAVQADVSDEAQVEAMFDKMMAEFGGVDMSSGKLIMGSLFGFASTMQQ